MTFTQAEKAGRDVWYSTVSASVEDIKFTEDPYDPVDGHLTGKTGTRVVFEIKNRDIPSLLYPSYILEEWKYRNLMIDYVKNGYMPLYVNIFVDKIMIWDISKIDITDRIVTKNCTRTTAANYHKGETPKEVILLKPEEAVWIKCR